MLPVGFVLRFGVRQLGLVISISLRVGVVIFDDLLLYCCAIKVLLDLRSLSLLIANLGGTSWSGAFTQDPAVLLVDLGLVLYVDLTARSPVRVGDDHVPFASNPHCHACIFTRVHQVEMSLQVTRELLAAEATLLRLAVI